MAVGVRHARQVAAAARPPFRATIPLSRCAPVRVAAELPAADPPINSAADPPPAVAPSRASREAGRREIWRLNQAARNVLAAYPVIL